MSFTVHLVRHGEVHNPQHLMYGRLPGYRLSQRGQQQAQAAALWLKSRPLAALHASPMQRARETASILAAHNGGLPVHIDERLIEVNTPFEGRPLSELFARDWDLYSGSGPEYDQPEDVARRGQAFLADMRRAWPEGEVAAVSHGDVIAFAILLGRRRSAGCQGQAEPATIRGDGRLPGDRLDQQLSLAYSGSGRAARI